MEIITVRDLIRDIVATWLASYPVCDPQHHMHRAALKMDHSRKSIEIYGKLLKLDVETATPKDVAKIIGNDSWTAMECDECGEKKPVAVARVGLDSDFDDRPETTICRACLKSALDAIEAKEKEGG
jgi:hypothetical protein